MTLDRRRASYLCLCATPFVAIVLAVRPLHVVPFRPAVGAAVFAAIAFAVWTLGAPAIALDTQIRRQLGLAGALLVAPFALIALLWVGLGTPWEATASENQMRYLVLLVAGTAEVGGLVMLREALDEAGERFYATLGFAAISLAGPLFVVWTTFAFAIFAAKQHTGEIPAVFGAFEAQLDLLLDIAGALIYVAAAAFAAALGRVQWLGRTATRTYVILNVVALAFLVNRGTAFLAPAQLSAPWYLVPGFIVGIPAVPFVMPSLLGAVLLRRAGAPQA